MSEDESVEAGRHTSQAFKALLSAALVVADAQRQRAVREMRRMESEARDREREANQRGQVGATLSRLVAVKAPVEVGVPVALADPVELAQRWAAAQHPDADPVQRVELDKQVRGSGVDPDQVRAEHPETDVDPGPAVEPGRASTESAGRSADRVQHEGIQHEGVWQQGSPEVAKAGLSYTRTPGRTITPGLSPQRRPKTAARTAAKTRDMGR